MTIIIQKFLRVIILIYLEMNKHRRKWKLKKYLNIIIIYYKLVINTLLNPPYFIKPTILFSKLMLCSAIKGNSRVSYVLRNYILNWTTYWKTFTLVFLIFTIAFSGDCKFRIYDQANYHEQFNFKMYFIYCNVDWMSQNRNLLSTKSWTGWYLEKLNQLKPVIFFKVNDLF